jgi:hypothetical protein
MDVALAVAIGAALLAAVAYLVSAARGMEPVRWHLWVAGVVEAMLLVVATLVLIGLAGGGQPGSPAVTLLYVVASLVTLPLALVWALGEPTRWSVAVLGGASLTVAILLVRLGQVVAGG